MLKKKIPHTYVIVFYLIIISAVLTWFIPGGAYEKETKVVNGIEREVVVSGSFHYVESEPQTWQVFSALYNGFINKDKNVPQIIIFILMIGGAFWIMNHSKAIDAGILAFLKFTNRLDKWRFFRFLGVDRLIVTLMMLVFSIFGAVFGMSEETIAFIIIFVPLSVSMGYDSITGVAMCFVGAGLGFAGAVLNPFTIGIAQGIADLPLFSGIEYRLFCWIVINITGIAFVLRYISKIRKNPKKSPVYEEDGYWREKSGEGGQKIQSKTFVSTWVVYVILLGVMAWCAFQYPMTTMKAGNASARLPVLPVIAGLFAVSGVLSALKAAHYFVLNLLFFTILFLITGVMGYGWYILEIATLFFVMGIFSGISMNYGGNKIVKLFLEGVKDIASAALIVGLAGGIIVILEQGNIIDTILHGVSTAIKGTGDIASVGMMYVVQTLINIVIPSGSAKAALTMPMMSQFSDLIGISRQATVMAYQFGDGFTNMITPTSGVLIGVLGVAKIPYHKWVRWITPLMIILVLLGLILLIPTVLMDLNGF